MIWNFVQFSVFLRAVLCMTDSLISRFLLITKTIMSVSDSVSRQSLPIPTDLRRPPYLCFERLAQTCLVVLEAPTALLSLLHNLHYLAGVWTAGTFRSLVVPKVTLRSATHRRLLSCQLVRTGPLSRLPLFPFYRLRSPQ